MQSWWSAPGKWMVTTTDEASEVGGLCAEQQDQVRLDLLPFLDVDRC